MTMYRHPAAEGHGERRSDTPAAHTAGRTPGARDGPYRISLTLTSIPASPDSSRTSA